MTTDIHDARRLDAWANHPGGYHPAWRVGTADDGAGVLYREMSGMEGAIRQEVIHHGYSDHPAVKLAAELAWSNHDLATIVASVMGGNKWWIVWIRRSEAAWMGLSPDARLIVPGGSSRQYAQVATIDTDRLAGFKVGQIYGFRPAPSSR